MYQQKPKTLERNRSFTENKWSPLFLSKAFNLVNTRCLFFHTQIGSQLLLWFSFYLWLIYSCSQITSITWGNYIFVLLVFFFFLLGSSFKCNSCSRYSCWMGNLSSGHRWSSEVLHYLSPWSPEEICQITELRSTYILHWYLFNSWRDSRLATRHLCQFSWLDKGTGFCC